MKRLLHGKHRCWLDSWTNMHQNPVTAEALTFGKSNFRGRFYFSSSKHLQGVGITVYIVLLSFQPNFSCASCIDKTSFQSTSFECQYTVNIHSQKLQRLHYYFHVMKDCYLVRVFQLIMLVLFGEGRQATSDHQDFW